LAAQPTIGAKTRRGDRDGAPAGASMAVIEEIDQRLLRSPIDFLMAEHYRLRAVLNHLDWLAREPVDAAWGRVAAAVLAYFSKDHPWHGDDEEKDLFPLLNMRCPDDAAIRPVLEVLASEHESDDVLATAVRSTMEARLEGPSGEPGSSLQIAIKAFTATQRRHLAWENAVVLPLARRYLVEDDLRVLAERMARRRGASLDAPVTE
jgi:hemerythrin-like domain-containing protein